MLCIVREVLFSVNKHTHLCWHLELFGCQPPLSVLQLKNILRITIPTS